MQKIMHLSEFDRSMIPESTETIVTTNGSFDLLHKGHVQSLYEASLYGDYLVVGLNSDESVRKYKSPTRPINKQEDRAYILAAFEMVDLILIFDDIKPIFFLGAVVPDVHVKSRSGYKGLEADLLKTIGAELVLIDDIQGYSSTEMLRRYLAEFWAGGMKR